MPNETNPELQRAVASAVDLVNTHSGETTVRLRFNDDDTEPEADFVANSASLNNGAFVFTAGFETYSGRIGDLAGIHAELIGH